MDLIVTLIEEIKTYSEVIGKARDYYEHSLTISEANHLPCVGAVEKRVQDKTPARFSDYFVQSTLGHREVVNNWKDLDKLILKPTVIKIVKELERRFSPENMAILKSLSAIDPDSDNFLNFETVEPMAEFYNLDMEGLEIELKHA